MNYQKTKKLYITTHQQQEYKKNNKYYERKNRNNLILFIVCHCGGIRSIHNYNEIKPMKTFKDLEFKPHYLSEYNNSLYKNTKQANLTFPNGYEVSVLLGACFYSNGKDTYEVMVTYENEEGEVEGYLTEEEVTELMIKTQKL